MKRVPFLLIGLVLVMLLAACERPLREETEAVTPTPGTNQVLEKPVEAGPDLTVPDGQTTDMPGSDGATPGAEPGSAPEGGEATPNAGQTDGQTGAAPDAPQQDIIHEVKAGDTLFALSLLYGVSVDDIITANALANPNRLDIGQQLLIPLSGTVTPPGDATGDAGASTSEDRVHVVLAGETLFRIGLIYGFTVEELASHNQLTNPDRLEVGQIIKIPSR